MSTSEGVGDPRLIAIDLDQQSIVWRSADIEQERRVAIFDLLEGNHFAPCKLYPEGYAGPYRLKLAVQEGRLCWHIASEDGQHLETLMLAMGRFQRPIREYFAICDSYFSAVKTSTPATIETIDMARRGIHDEASHLLKERLAGKIDIDFDTARRLFTLICVLHIRG
ncbi:UPF0262 protein BMEI1669 [Sphingomonas antarctica]